MSDELANSTAAITNWILKQVPVIILLIGTNIAQYYYFTGQIVKLENRVEHLQDKIIDLKR